MTVSLGMGNHRQRVLANKDSGCRLSGRVRRKEKSYSPDAKAAVARAIIVIRRLMFGLMPERRRGKRRI